MPGPANIRSDESIARFRAALIEFAAHSRDGLDQLEQEIRRAVDWLDHDRPQHWREQIRRREDDVHCCKLELERCLMSRVSEERPSCYEERTRLHKAKAALAMAREKAEAVQHWRRQIHHEHFEYQGRVGQLGQVLDDDVARGVAKLGSVLSKIEAYRATRTMAPNGYNEQSAQPSEAPDASGGAASPQDP